MPGWSEKIKIVYEALADDNSAFNSCLLPEITLEIVWWMVELYILDDFNNPVFFPEFF
jgi:hypothetical protein